MRIAWTASINERVATDEEFAKFLTISLHRYWRRDWGEMDNEDKAANNYAVKNGERILASYDLPERTKHGNGIGDHRIWIITEADRNVTTILWPSEY